MEEEMEGVIPAVSVERTDENQVDSAVSNRDDEVIGFLLQVSFQLFLWPVFGFDRDIIRHPRKIMWKLKIRRT